MRLYFPNSGPCTTSTALTTCRARIEKLEAALKQFVNDEFLDVKPSYIAALKTHTFSETATISAREKSRGLLDEAKDSVKWAILASLVKHENKLKAEVFAAESTLALAYSTWGVQAAWLERDAPPAPTHIPTSKRAIASRIPTAPKDESELWGESFPPGYVPQTDEELADRLNKLSEGFTEDDEWYRLYQRYINLQHGLARQPVDSNIPANAAGLKQEGNLATTNPAYAYSRINDTDEEFKRLRALRQGDRRHIELLRDLGHYDVLRFYDEDRDVEQAMKEYMFDFDDRSEAALIKLAGCMEIGMSPFDLMIKSDYMNTKLHLRNPLALHLSLGDRAKLCEENIKELQHRLDAANQKLARLAKDYGHNEPPNKPPLKVESAFDKKVHVYLRKRAVEMTTDLNGSKYKANVTVAFNSSVAKYEELKRVLYMSAAEETNEETQDMEAYENHLAARKSLKSDANKLEVDMSSLTTQAEKRLAELYMELEELKKGSDERGAKALGWHITHLRRILNKLSGTEVPDQLERVNEVLSKEPDIGDIFRKRKIARKVLIGSYKNWKRAMDNNSELSGLFDDMMTDFAEYEKSRFSEPALFRADMSKTSKYLTQCGDLASQLNRLSSAVIAEHLANEDEIMRKKLLQLAYEEAARGRDTVQSNQESTKKQIESAKKNQTKEDDPNVETPRPYYPSLEETELTQQVETAEMFLHIEKETMAKAEETEIRSQELIAAKNLELSLVEEKVKSAEKKAEQLQEKIAELESLRETASTESLKETAELNARIELLRSSLTAQQNAHTSLVSRSDRAIKRFRERATKNHRLWTDTQTQLARERTYVQALETTNAAVKKRNAQYAKEYASKRMLVSSLRTQLRTLEKHGETREGDIQNLQKELDDAGAVLTEMERAHAIEVDQLRHENDAALAEIKEGKESLKQAEREMTQVQTELVAEREANTQLRDALEKSQNRVKSLELSALKMSEDNIEGNAVLERRMREAQADVVRLQERVREYEELVLHQDTISTTAQDFEKLKEEALRDRELLDVAHNERRSLETKLQTEIERSEEQAKLMDAAVAEKAELNTKLAEFEKKYENSMKENENIREIQKMLKLTEAEREKLKEGMETAAREATGIVENLHQELDRERKTVKQLQLDQTAIRRELAEKIREGSGQESRIAELSAALSALQAKQQRAADAAQQASAALEANLQTTLSKCAMLEDKLTTLTNAGVNDEARRQELVDLLAQLRQEQSAKDVEIQKIKADHLTTVGELSSTIESWKASAESSIQQIEIWRNTCALKDITISQLNTDVAEVNAQLDIVREQARLKEEENVKLQGDLKARNSKLEMLETQMQSGNEKLNAAMEEKARLDREVKIAKLQLAFRAIKTGRVKAAFRKEKDDSTARLNESMRQVKERDNVIKTLQQQQAITQGELTKLQTGVDVKTTELHAARWQVGQLQREANVLRRDFAIAKTEIENMKASVQKDKEHHQQVIAAALKSDRKKQEQINILQSQVDEILAAGGKEMGALIEMIQQLNFARANDIATMNAMAAAFEQQRQELQQKISDVENSAKEQSVRISEIEGQVTARENDIKVLQKERDELRSDNESLLNRIHMNGVEMEQRLKEKNEAELALNARVNKVTAMYDLSQAALAVANETVAQKGKLLLDAANECKNLKSELVTAKTDLIQEQLLHKQTEKRLLALDEGWAIKYSSLIAQKEVETKRLETQLQEGRNETLALQRNKAEMEKEVDTLKTEQAAMKKNYDELEQQKKVLDNAYQNSQKRERQAERSKNDDETRYTELLLDLSKAKNETERVTNELRGAESRVLTCDQKITDLDKRLANALARVKLQETMATEYESEKTRYKQTIEDLKGERARFIESVKVLVAFSEQDPDDTSMTIETAAKIYADFEIRKAVDLETLKLNECLQKNLGLESEIRGLRTKNRGLQNKLALSRPKFERSVFRDSTVRQRDSTVRQRDFTPSQLDSTSTASQSKKRRLP